MQDVIDHSQQYVKEDPLLLLLKRQASAVALGFDDCGCADSFNSAAYHSVFDQMIAKSWLGGAGMSAESAGEHGAAAILLSEALRFAPNSGEYLESRSSALANLGDAAWAIDDGNRAIKIDPEDKHAWTARGYAYTFVRDYAHAERDYRVALNLKPGDEWTLNELGRIYVYSTHEYDKGWDVANQMTQNHPEDPDGWTFRASIQKDQPRPGLQDTIRYFIAHFGNDPQQQSVVAQMRPYLAQKSTRH